MKVVLILGWLFLLADVVGVLWLLLVKNAGNTGLAIGFGLAFTPAALIAAGLLVLGQVSGNRAGILGGFFLAGLPVFIGAGIYVSGELEQRKYRAYAAQAGRFDSPKLTAIAAAIDAKAFDRLRDLAKQTPIDWTARDKHGRTLLGFALIRAMDSYPPAGTEALEILLDAGAPLIDDALQAASENNQPMLLMPTLMNTRIELLALFLKHGGDPNAKANDGAPIAFDTWCDLPKLKLLAEHGADLNAIDKRGWSLVMKYADASKTEQLEWALAQGADPNHCAPDGKTLASIQAERRERRGAR